ncbi:amino acid adenylation domain-containing protein [Actinoplanes sp. NPDC020271]|uniref:amino acid adenylation domain-containing protein n=1 Tax=Actinoplanes sp. NPDC020271 TaxID=3363896 RepID=UPI0037B459B9
MTIDGFVHAQVDHRPDAVAVVDADGSHSYLDLWRRSGRLAVQLQEAGVVRGDIVAFDLPRGMPAIVAMLAAMRAGAVYLPLNSDDPAARRARILADAAPRVLLAAESDAEVPPGVSVIVPDGYTPANSEPAAPVHGDSDAAYVLYTSGSTGEPKGVVIEHRGVLNLVSEPRLGLSSSDVIAHCASDAFDVTIFEVWGALMWGGTCVVVEPFMVLESRDLDAFLARHGVTVLFLTTAVLNFLADESMTSLAALRLLVFGGERANPRKLRQVLGQLRRGRTALVHAYGPTENSMMSTLTRLDETNVDRAPIGTPLHNMDARLIDDKGREVVGDGVGELYVSGPGLARGYLGRPDLTANCFVLVGDGDVRTRYYRTGDECRRVEGVLEFLGRRDGMVKVQGRRVELGEIEAVVAKHDGVHQSAVVFDEAAGGRLRAYVVCDEHLDFVELRSFLSDRLPAYMVPRDYVRMTELPLGPTAKVDRRALAALSAAEHA